MSALKELNMTVYDVMDHYSKFRNNWLKVVEQGHHPVDVIKLLYSDVDVVAGFPIWYFWEEFHKAFPEAKVLTLPKKQDILIWVTCRETTHPEIPNARDLLTEGIS